VKRLSLRVKLTLVYVGLFVTMAALLLGIDYTLMDRTLPTTPSENVLIQTGIAGANSGVTAPTDSQPGAREALTIGQANIIAGDIRAQTLQTLLVQSGLALLVAAALAIVFGWLLAGRVVGPVKTVTAQARRMSERNLHERIAMQGPQDELKDLADTFDGMLARLDAAFEGQRLFVANASHELRTPLAITRAAVDVQLQRAKPSQEQWKAMAEMVLRSTSRSERLIGSLLLLARIEQGSHRHAAVDLSGVLDEVVIESRPLAQKRSIRLDELRPDTVMVAGDEELLRRMIGNLLENAVRHNQDGGFVRVELAAGDGIATLTVTNGGEMLADSAVRDLAQPFQRGGASRSAGEGAGLGLSIVKSIAGAHGGRLGLRARPDGGLEVTVRIPLA
jgi:signal transduction histidine kinase